MRPQKKVFDGIEINRSRNETPLKLYERIKRIKRELNIGIQEEAWKNKKANLNVETQEMLRIWRDPNLKK